MKKILIALLVVTSFLQISCSPDTINNTPTTNPVDVYVAGSKTNQACYWKNNQLVMLDSNGLPSSYATKIIVSNGDVYVLGRGGTPTVIYSLFWKNGVLTNLTSTLSTSDETLSSVTGMYIDSNDVYFSGTTINSSSMTNTVYWKNGIKTILSANDNIGIPGDIIVKNNTVYIISTKGINQITTKGYYINSIFYPENTDYVGLNGIYENNNDVFVYGTKDNTSSGSNYKGYYKNVVTGVETILPNIQEIKNFNIDSGNIYYNSQNNLYCNNTAINPVFSGFLRTFTVLNGNIYTISNIDDNSLGVIYYMNINGVNSLQINTNEGVFMSLYVVQN